MNKEQAYTNAVAADRHVCNQHSFDAGWDAAIAELAKQSEPSLSEDVLEDMARSEYESAMSFGINVDNFMRLAKSVAKRAAPLTQADDESELLKALEELVNLMQGVIDGDYKPYSFTLQPANKAIAAHKARLR